MAPVPTTPAEDPESATPYTRLHITPFNLSLQNVVIPASVLPRARNISYHTIETFPEKCFGFVDLPTMDADKLKKKLNGAVLKGTKIRVETARPEPIPELTADTDAAKTKKEKKEKKKSKKRKHEADVIEGIQLEGRKVKRGWTTTEQEMIDEKRKRVRKENKDDKSSKDEKKDKKDKKMKRATVKSKYTDDPECLFKTKLPGPGPSTETKETDEEASTQKKKRKRKSDREVIVHEFEKTTKYPTFLKSSSTTAIAKATTFKDGVGWVDSTGNVVEPVKSKRRPEGIPAPNLPKPKKVAPISHEEEDDDDETSSSGSSSSDEEEDDDSFSSGSESDVSTKQTEKVAPLKQLKVETLALSSPSAIAKPESSRPKSSGSITSLSIKIPPTTPAAKKIHPLEALYKRPSGGDSAPNGDSEAQPFSFFGNEDDIEENEDSTAPASQAPMTPFTTQEFEFRNVRSAAPTPDTAHPSRSFNFWASQGATDDDDLDDEDDVEGLGDVQEEQEQEDEDVDMEDGVAGGQTSQTPGSDFQKQFWERRGDLNRAWRKRRKSAAKEKRYRDNRARAERAI
ncbi:hypothetical protein E0Z10_g5996 [Xylaria hypoxylon]|uniref:Uncharacterized protein n=1 Tax=Xylaria hypoxylon TaxID=37992 RepID=A0A4Z0YER2_9PEZI|nr:hypothetical protein E0Z10_g5996 [Xylaria hypoxylon]